jgi:hypothetical protein
VDQRQAHRSVQRNTESLSAVQALALPYRL